MENVNKRHIQTDTKPIIYVEIGSHENDSDLKQNLPSSKTTYNKISIKTENVDSDQYNNCQDMLHSNPGNIKSEIKIEDIFQEAVDPDIVDDNLDTKLEDEYSNFGQHYLLGSKSQ